MFRLPPFIVKAFPSAFSTYPFRSSVLLCVTLIGALIFTPSSRVSVVPSVQFSIAVLIESYDTFVPSLSVIPATIVRSQLNLNVASTTTSAAGITKLYLPSSFFISTASSVSVLLTDTLSTS